MPTAALPIPSADTSAEPAPGPAVPEPAISVDLPPAEKTQLIGTTQRELEQAAAAVRSIETGLLSPAEEETLRTIRALMEASREATERSEIREAASLAHKAWVLAVEMSKR